MRTLVISDLHLGGRLQRSVLTFPAALARLLEAIVSVQRVVLLGDVVELLEGRGWHALDVAEPVLRAIGKRLGTGGEVIVVPGNHDLRLVRSWIRAQGTELTVDTAIPLSATPSLARLTSWFAPARVRVHYPGVWLSERIWATHGHYLDRHLLPESAFGVARGLLGRLPDEGATPLDYEFAGGPSVTHLEALLTRVLPRPLAALVEDLAEFARASTMPNVSVSRRFFHHRMWRLTSMLLGLQMRRASIPALARVVRSLGISADWVLFGHVHRLGPLAGDRKLEWQAPGGAPRILNTGSWVYEPLLVHGANPPHPYWPGGAVLLEPERGPEVVGLLDGLDAAALH